MSFEQQLRDDLRRAGDSVPIEPVSWDQTLGRARRTRRLYVALAGAAAAVMLAAAVAAGSSLLDRGQALRPVGPSPSPSPAPPPEREVTSGEVEPTVRAWIRAISDGDARKAWSLLTDRARAGIGGYPRFAEMVSNELADGLGAFARAQQARYATSLVASPAGVSGVVTVVGVVEQEGTQRENAVTVPFRVLALGRRPEKDRVLIDQSFDGAWGIDSLSPAREFAGGNVLRRGGRLETDILPASGHANFLPSVRFHIDGDALLIEARRVDRVEDSSGEKVRASARLPQSVEPGPHLLTIVAVDERGFTYSKALTFEVSPR